jgi:3-deoxy-D-manno-octulosonic-acid transferase
MTFWIDLYRHVTAAAAPAVRAYLRLRRRRGKEDPRRLNERLGIASRPRLPGPLVWVHAASVGEAQSVLGLIERIVAQRPGLAVLMTTGTVASAGSVAGRLPVGAQHQYVPVDTPGAVDRFLDHWRPDLAIWVESEMWPNLVLETHRRGVPMVLANGRLSARSAARWRLLPGLIRPVLGAFSLCFVQDAAQMRRFRALGARNVEDAGDLKAAAAPLPADPAALMSLRQGIGTRPVWLAASTHPGEEDAAAAAHALVARDHPGLLTLIVPRHPVRGTAIAEQLRALGLRVARRSAGETIDAGADIYVADTFGELGLFFRIARIAFVGGSLVRKGGHNPFEAARLGCVVLHGPDMANCIGMATALDAAGAALTVNGATELASAVSRLLASSTERDERAAAGTQAAADGDGALDVVLDRLSPWLDRLAPVIAEPVSPRCRRTAGRDAYS